MKSLIYCRMNQYPIREQYPSTPVVRCVPWPRSAKHRIRRCRQFWHGADQAVRCSTSLRVVRGAIVFANDSLHRLGGNGGTIVVRSIFYATAFSIAALVLAGGIEVVLVAGMSAAAGGRYQIVPRGLGWIVLPISAMIGGWRVGEAFDPQRVTESIRLLADVLTKGQRLWVGCSAIWLVFCCLFFLLFDPFHRYFWQAEEWEKFIFVCAAPMAVAFLGKKVLDWSSRT